jgi:hypothetical protein
VLLSDNFNYADGALLTANGWTAHSGAGTAAIDVGVSNGLSYAGYSGLAGITGAEVGNAARLDNTGEDVNRAFGTAVTSGTLYYSFLINVTTGTAGYFLHLGNGTANFAARIYVKPSATSGKINFGLSNTSTASYATIPTDFESSTTYLIIVKYDVSTTGAVSMWVKAGVDLPLTEATAGAPEHTNSGTGIALIEGIYLRQYSSTQNITVDGIRVATAWPVDGTLGVGKNEIANFALYPNPVKGGKVFISSNNNDAERTVAIFDVLGKQVVAQKGTQSSVEVSHLTKGVYIIKVTEEGKTATRKLVVE